MSDLSFEAAAEELGCKVRWLKDNYRRFEHQEYGIQVSFTHTQLDKIREACRAVPVEEQQAAETSADTSGRISITELRPSQRRRRASI